MTDRERIEAVWRARLALHEERGLGVIPGDVDDRWLVQALLRRRNQTLTAQERTDLAALEAKYLPPRKEIKQ